MVYLMDGEVQNVRIIMWGLTLQGFGKKIFSESDSKWVS